MKTYLVKQVVRFAHCDPAGIIFYPRFFEILNGIVEDWFSDALGCSFGVMLKDYGIGTPLVDVHAEFLKPCFLDDILESAFLLTYLGNSSAKFAVKCYVSGHLNIKAEGVLVCSKRDLSASRPWPKHIVSEMENFVHSKPIGAVKNELG